MKQDCSINKLIEMKEMLDEYLSNMDLLNEDGSVKTETEEEKPTEEDEKEEVIEEVEPEDDEAKDDEISDRDAIIMIRKAK